MRQILQNMGNGETSIVDAPCPTVKEKNILIQTKHSLISVGTERMLLEFGKANFIDKARQQPDKVKMVLDKVKTDGLATTIDAVRSKLDQPLALGYCNVGRVVKIGRGCDQFKIGDRIVSNGPHADIVRVPKNLCAKIPDNVDDESAAFTVLASIGLQGIRLAKPSLGEAFVVTGLGLIGLLTVQLLKAHGCRVLGIDFDSEKLALAEKFGAETVNLSKGEDPVAAGLAFSRGKGVDGVLITASTKSSEPVSQAAKMCRKRGRIILVGVTGLELSRADFYEKELSFQVSCSYGPGRYDDDYEQKGQDYPIGFVRWTEQRNFEAVLDMMSEGRLDVSLLISSRFDFSESIKAYDLLTENPSTLGILLDYPDQSQEDLLNSKICLTNSSVEKYSASEVVCGFIGAGNYASRILIPAFKDAGANLCELVTSGGISGVHHGKKAGFDVTSTDIDAMLDNSSINTVAIVTQHNSHAKFVIKSLDAGKNVFVEKPLALTHEELDDIQRAYENQIKVSGKVPGLMVGFNRRFSPQIIKMKELLGTVSEPKSFIFTINAGAIPVEHWTQDLQIGGGRIIGEACHFIDLMRFLAGSKISSIKSMMMGATSSEMNSDDKAAILLGFEDGSFGTINYLANGSNKFPKERIEVFSSGKTIALDNFRKMIGYDFSGFKKMNLSRQDKGQSACAEAFVKAIRVGEPTPIPFEEIMEISRVTIDVANDLRRQG